MLFELAKPDARSRALQTLDTFWGTFEIAGVAPVDMRMWHWMYDHPDASPARLREAVLILRRESGIDTMPGFSKNRTWNSWQSIRT
jgi:hypothetical protein